MEEGCKGRREMEGQRPRAREGQEGEGSTRVGEGQEGKGGVEDGLLEG